MPHAPTHTNATTSDSDASYTLRSRHQRCTQRTPQARTPHSSSHTNTSCFDSVFFSHVRKHVQKRALCPLLALHTGPCRVYLIPDRSFLILQSERLPASATKRTNCYLGGATDHHRITIQPPSFKVESMLLDVLWTAGCCPQRDAVHPAISVHFTP
jgi:hypothetical protein